MNNPFIEHLPEYVNLMRNFVNKRISSAKFTTRYINCRDKDVDDEYRMINNSATGDSDRIISRIRYKNGEISLEEYMETVDKYLKLNPITSKIHAIINECYTDCDCCYEDDEGFELDPPLVINGEMLRELVEQHLKKLKILAREANLDV